MYRLIVPIFIICFSSSCLLSQYNPGMSYSTVLNGVKLFQSETGVVSLGAENFLTSFLEKDTEGKIILKSGDGTELINNKFVAEGDRKPFKLVNIWGNTRLKLTEGDYTVEWEVNGATYFKFPFSITKIAGENPFESGDKYFLEGDWADWGYFYYSDAKTDKELNWKVWLRNKSLQNEKDIKVKIMVTNDKTKKLICVSRENVTHTLRNDWTRFQFDMVFPPGQEKYGSYFKAIDLLKNDGDYTLKMEIDGVEYGKWRFSIKDSKFVLRGRSDRKTADPLTFIEGGLDAFWYEREK